MGREAIAVARWQGAVEEVKALLESHEIILRGAIKARIPRSGISMIAVTGDELALSADGKPLVLELGAKEAAKWHDVLLRPLPSLASKLGIGPDKRAFMVGKTDDVELNAALVGATCAKPGDASVLVAIIECKADLTAAFALANKHRKLFLWCAYEKGTNAAFGDDAVRTFLRKNGYVDNKSCAVSARLTATRYGRKA